MINGIFKVVKYALYLFGQSVFQPSKIYAFIKNDKKNVYVFMCVFFFVGLILGVILAIPNYYIYRDLTKSIFLALSLACTFSFIVAGSCRFQFLLAFAGANDAFLFFFMFLLLLTIVFLLFFLFLFTVKSEVIFVLFEVAFTSAFAGVVTGAIGGSVSFKGLFVGLLTAFFVVGTNVNSYEIILFPLSFISGYIIISQIDFIIENKKFNKHFEEHNIEENDVTRENFKYIQKSSLIWCSIIALLLYLPVFFSFKPNLHTKLTIMAIGFIAMPIFILHIPDYFLCLPVWLYQVRKASKNIQNIELLREIYDNSLLFKHEMLYFQLPDLHKFMTFFAKSHEFGIREAFERVNHLYWFTFQQKQAQKAIIELGKDKETAHQYIHFLIQEDQLSNYFYRILIRGEYPS